jgi:hypothetical protein
MAASWNQDIKNRKWQDTGVSMAFHLGGYCIWCPANICTPLNVALRTSGRAEWTSISDEIRGLRLIPHLLPSFKLFYWNGAALRLPSLVLQSSSAALQLPCSCPAKLGAALNSHPNSHSSHLGNTPLPIFHFYIIKVLGELLLQLHFKIDFQGLKF